MDKNTITGFVLIAIVLFGFSWFSRPSEEEIRAQRQQDSIAAVTQEKKEIERKQAEAKKLAQAKAALEDSTVLFYSALNGKAQDVVLENEKVALTFSTKGATVNKAVVKNFTDRNGKKDVTLFDGNDQELNYILVAKQMNISTQDLYFTPTAQTKSSVTFVAKAAEGKTLEISYSLGKDYLLSCSIKANGMAGLFDPSQSSININWKDRVRQQEKGFTFENNRSALTYHFSDGSTDYLTETKKYTDEAIEEKTDWIAFKNQFFSAVMISKTDFADNALLTSIPYEKEEVDGYLKQYEAKLKTAFDPSG
ncbi:MAG: membrane protein insertase YidC, partial [Prevotellaceae bacterium]|nr:membrane protein insertase YidC [Prevotellaceae bacterium]